MDYTFLGLLGLGTITPCLSGFLLLFYVYPNHMVRLTMKLRSLHAGMRIKYVKDADNNFTFCYAEKNKYQAGKTSVVFIHGFTASKDQWITMFKDLPTNIHLIAIDLPGHGGSTTPEAGVIPDIDWGMERLNRVLDLIGFSNVKVHLVGTSLGGATVGIFAAKFPERVAKVTMVCPAMESPELRPFVSDLKERTADIEPDTLSYADCPLLPQDVGNIKKMFDLVCYNKVSDKIHLQFWKGVLQLRLKRNEFFLRLFRCLASPENMNTLVSLAPNIKMPSQVIWGRDDQIFHVSGAEFLASKLPNCRHLDVLDKCGHVLDVDRPGAFTNTLLKFINDDDQSEGKKIV